MIDDNMVIIPTKKQGTAVIASFSTDGEIIPLYFQGIENEEKFSFKVRVMGRKENNVIIKFLCAYDHNGIEKYITLLYWKRDHIWTL